MPFITPSSDIAVFATPVEDTEGFVTPEADVAAEEEGFIESGGKTEVAGVPLDFGGVLRAFETAPEFATRMSRGDSLADAALGTADYVAGIEPSAVDEESAKLAATFNQEQAEGHAMTAGLNALAKLGGIPTSTTGKGVILGPLEIARQVAKRTTDGTPVIKAAEDVVEGAIAPKQLELGVEKQQLLPLVTPKSLEEEALAFRGRELAPASKLEVEAEQFRVQQREANQVELFQARQLPPEQQTLNLGEDSTVFMKRGASDETAAEVGERALVNPEGTTVADVVGAIDTSPIVSKAGRVVNFLGGKAITPIRKAGQHSPAMKKIADLMGGGEDNLIRGFQHDQWRATGKFVTQLDDAVQSVRRFTGGISKKVNNKLVADLRSGAKTPSALAVRKVLNSFHTYLKDAGVDVGFATNFFPRKYNVDLLNTAKGKQQWVDTMAANGMSTERALEAHSNIVNGGGFMELAVDRSGRLLEGAPAVSSSLKGRTIDMSDEVLAPFLRSDNAHTILRDYIEAGTRTAEYTRRFGKKESELNSLMAQASKELGAKGKDIAEVKQHVYDVADTLVHSYNRLPPNSVIGNLNKIAVPLMHILTLPLATVASLTEPIMILGRASLRPSAALKTLPAIMNSVIRNTVRTVFKGVDKAAATRSIEELGLGLDAAMAERLQAISQGDVSGASSVFFKANFLHQWTRFVMIAANETGKHMIKGHLKELARGVTANKQVALSKDLLSLGVDPKAGVAWIKRGADESEPFFQEAVKGGGQRFTTDVVMIPRSTELPLWHANPRVKLLSQLKSFPTMFGNTIMNNWYQQIAKGTPKQKFTAAATGATATVGGMMTSELTDYLRYGEDGNPRVADMEPYEKVLRGVEKFGGLGVGSIGRDALMSNEFGRDAATVLLGPAVSKATELIEVVTKKDKPRAAARVIANNLSFVSANKEVRTDVAEAVEDFLREFE